MTNSKGWLALILGVLAVGAAWVSLDFKPTTATGAPLAQATATSTATNTPQAPTSTPLILDGPGTVSLGGQVVVGVVATRGAAGTPAIYEPVKTDGSGRLQMAAAPNGAVAAQTPVAVAMAGQQIKVRSTVVVPAQTPVAYTVGDVITSATPAALTFANACRVNGGSGYVVAADLATDQSTYTGANRLWLYQSPPPTLVADNAANVLSFTNNAIRIGYIDLPSAATNTGTSTAAFAQNPDARLSYTCAAGSTTLSGVLEASSAFTPASAQTFDAGLSFARD